MNKNDLEEMCFLHGYICDMKSWFNWVHLLGLTSNILSQNFGEQGLSSFLFFIGYPDIYSLIEN